jgi:hypothetical protein
MTPEEVQALRIGNWVNVEYFSGKIEPKQVDGYVFWHLMFPNDARHTIENTALQYIPITHEWILKLGFKETKGKDENKIYIHRVHGKYVDVFENKGKFFSGYNGYAYALKIDYVHQLQNLFFVITGKELIYETERS